VIARPGQSGDGQHDPAERFDGVGGGGEEVVLAEIEGLVVDRAADRDAYVAVAEQRGVDGLAAVQAGGWGV
jgi:hypothetical protein